MVVLVYKFISSQHWCQNFFEITKCLIGNPILFAQLVGRLSVCCNFSEKLFMKNKRSPLWLISFLLLTVSFCHATDEHKTLTIGADAPDFKLPGVDGKTYSLSSFKNAKVLVIIFTCNHCPTAQAYEERLVKLTSDYKDKGVAVVAILPNDPKAVNLDELGYTDLSDSFEEMKIRSKEKHFNFPYLYDGETQSVSIAYGPVATPHVFIFNSERKLSYQGRIDDVEKPTKIPNHFDTRNAIDELLADKPVTVQTTKVFGCEFYLDH